MTPAILDPANVLHSHNPDLRAKFNRHTLHRYGVYCVHTLTRLSVI